MAKNANCLRGYECPKCQSQGPFWAKTTCLAKWCDDGTEETQEHEIEEQAGHMRCCGCDYRGHVNDFQTEAQDG